MNAETYIRNLGGWLAAGHPFVYASTDSPTFTFTIAGVDLSLIYTPGVRIKLTQATGGTKYFIVTKVAFSTDTTVTIYGGTDYTLNNETITAPFLSREKAPQGFPLDPAKWTVEVTDSTSASQIPPTINTWYNLRTMTISIPIGIWAVRYNIYGYAIGAASGTEAGFEATLSTANNSATDTQSTSALIMQGVTSGANPILGGLLTRDRVIALTAKTSYFLNERVILAAQAQLHVLNASVPASIRAVCAYL